MESAGATNVFPLPDRENHPMPPVHEALQPDRGRSVLRDALQSIWENSNESMRLTDGTGVIVAVNPAFCSLVDMKEEQLIGKHFTVIYPAGDTAEQIRGSYDVKFRSGNIKTRYEKTYTLWSGKVLDVEVVSSFVDSDDGQRYMLAQFRDMTAQRLMQRALVESEMKYRRLFANSVQPMFESTIDGKLVNANRALLRLLGYETMMDLKDLDIERDIYVNPEDRRLMIQALKLRGYITNAEIQLRRRNGKTITVTEHARAVMDSQGAVIGFEGILEDVTARKATEHKIQQYLSALEESKNALAELNAQKDKLLSILSHDLRSPFSSILGFCEVLQNESDQLTDQERREFLGYIEESAKDQLELVNKLLDWSRLETGRIKMDEREVDLKDIVEKSVMVLMGLAKQKGIALASTVPAGLVVRGDAQLLQQVFTNLVGNALKFTPRDGSITLSFEGEQDHHWVVAVRDTGIGIPQADLPKLFKVEEKYTRKGLGGEKGTGLGLPVVYEIMQKHNGDISVESSPDRGTSFLLRFPNARPASGLSVLIVDDEPGARVLHARYVRKCLPGATILQASDGAEAFELARRHCPALILSDYDMPDVDGFELLSKIRGDETTRGIPVVIITGHDSHASHEALLLSGAVDIIQKPVTPDRMAEVLRILAPPVQS